MGAVCCRPQVSFLYFIFSANSLLPCMLSRSTLMETSISSTLSSYVVWARVPLERCVWSNIQNSTRLFFTACYVLQVRVVQHKQTRELYALKYINKVKCVKMKAVANVIQERRLLEEVRAMRFWYHHASADTNTSADRPCFHCQLAIRFSRWWELLFCVGSNAGRRFAVYVLDITLYTLRLTIYPLPSSPGKIRFFTRRNCSILRCGDSVGSRLLASTPHNASVSRLYYMVYRSYWSHRLLAEI